MTLNPQNPQRGTGVRKAATGVRPAVPAEASAPAARPATGRVPAVAPAPAARPATGRVPAVAPAAPARRPGAPVGGAPRPALRSGAAPQQGGKGTKYLMLTIIVLLLGMIAYVFIPMGGHSSLGVRLARKYGLLKKESDKPAEESAAAPVGLDAKYKAAIAMRERAQNFLADQDQKYKDNPQTLTATDIHRVLGELEKYRAEVYLGVDDINSVVSANGKDTTIDAATAKEELKKQKTSAMDLGKALVKWKGPKDQIFSSSSDFVANKFTSTPVEPKPAEKRDPKSLMTVVAPATPNDVPKPPDAPKEDPKPAEPKPEPEKPKPAEPKPEPEKPKEEPKPEPKPEPEKPKPAEPKPEPEKPKPAEPKPEPEKPKEEPKPEPKPEPEKPKPVEPKPEPEKPKEEPKPAKKVDLVVAEADKLVQDGYPLAKDVIGASKNLPSDPEKLKTLSMKAETAQAFFVKARDTYTEIKDAAPESADITTKLGKIEKILALLQNASDAIKSKMK